MSHTQTVSNRVQDNPKRVNPSKKEVKNLHETSIFSFYTEESKNDVKLYDLFMLEEAEIIFLKMSHSVKIFNIGKQKQIKRPHFMYRVDSEIDKFQGKF